MIPTRRSARVSLADELRHAYYAHTGQVGIPPKPPEPWDEQHPSSIRGWLAVADRVVTKLAAAKVNARAEAASTQPLFAYSDEEADGQ